ncbi:MAG: Holliday junction resolvase RuvX [Saccharofermentans sp.]|nr:Holliday junction resolvase RuvX [Mageeibacillus sp.]MCI1264783.1 Holliday junction resolvase RuvX [Saccharofermentans sp.]MCI1275283.1 Holliday junction resolvase RuvX [Saccharofermentans sp.]MCI1769694.1 Holliday junction resolvase RuvX [Mageeibacillus sp.]MCI2044343.1 Holliday junction resolvase RuvX [Mageeibacillus sp.]
MGQLKGRVMGVDFGTRHIGIALSDESRILATGYETVNWNGTDPEWALNRICDIIKEMNVIALVFGKPSRTDGTKSETECKAEVFAGQLQERCAIAPVFRDERFTTVIASQYLHECNINAKKQKKVIDQVAAEIILQEYLDSIKRN